MIKKGEELGDCSEQHCEKMREECHGETGIFAKANSHIDSSLRGL